MLCTPKACEIFRFWWCLEGFGTDKGDSLWSMRKYRISNNILQLLNVCFATCGIVASIHRIHHRADRSENTEHAGQTLFVSPMYSIKSDNFYISLKQWWWLGQSAYIWTVSITKIYIAMSALRFTSQKSLLTILYTIITLSCVVNVTFWLVFMLQCHPVKEFWQNSGRGRCIEGRYIVYTAYIYSAFAFACDVGLVCVAGSLVSKLHMNKRTKFTLTGVLSMGCM